MITIKSYVPMIRWRPAEVKAIKSLYLKDRSEMTPFFEFILPPPTMDKKDYKKILEDSKTKFLRKLPNISKEIINCWGQEPVFIDVHLLDSDIRKYAFEQILSSSNDLGISSIPVIYVVSTESEADIATRNLAIKFSKINNNGLCIRIDESHLDANLSGVIENFVRINKLNIDTIDIIVDLKIIDEKVIIESIVEKIANIPHIEKWRSFILTGGSFPKDLANLEKHSHYSMKRFDWHLWNDIFQGKKLKRCPIFSDYTIQHPIYFGHIPGNINVSASMRYTSDEVWEVIRGEGLRNEKGAGFKQYPAQAQLLVEQSFFKGADYSFGDAYIAEKAQPKNKATGSPQTWLTAGVNHHLTLVVRQIASLL